MTAPRYWSRATRELARADPVLGRFIDGHKALALGSRGDAFQTLSRAIVGQQISVKAAQSVWNRFATRAGSVTPAHVLALTADDLRGCGLSARKAEYLHDLAARLDDGTLRPDKWTALPDEALIAELVQVKGIGRWTAQMFLIFNLARPDVFPVGDLGLVRAMQLHYNKGRPLSDARVQTLSRRWSPWRSVATWYLWRSLDPVPVNY